MDHVVPGVAGVVHHDVAAAEGVDRGLDDPIAEVLGGDITDAGDRAPALLLDRRDRLV